MSAFIVLVKNSSYNIQLQGIGCTKGKILKIEDVTLLGNINMKTITLTKNC